ncbi:TraB/GumN family protein [Phenylobacterium sp.]|uniref:TraB/GumN family protein n=1 Tax=Phenylobacterium sp. TaxID=1871053 RepID=UPI0026000877|nr:TraB/GumN family protein [Phenylobacterium sp.]MBX3483680.1 TraB/GumN family protein [Phenylobacterium sp.]
MRARLAGLAAAFALATPAFAEPPVWVVRDKDSELVLFGSVHVLPPGLAWKPAALEAALGKADDLWFELPIGPEADREISLIAATRGVLPPGQSIFRLLPPKDAALLIKVADAYGVDRLTLDRLEPWLAEVTLAAAAYRRAGADTSNGVEATLSATTPPAVRRKALETPARQLGLIDGAPLRDQIASLRQTLQEMDRDPEAYMKLVRAWMAADVKGLEREALAPLRRASPGVFDRLVVQRNADWTRQLDARLKGQGRTVVVVGVGHLIGPEGLPARLRALGYSVTGP